MVSKKFQTIDGNYAASYVSYALSEVAAIYPITPSSNMGENCDEFASKGMRNIFNQVVKVVEMQSEGGAAGAVHGSLTAGSLTTTYTASQGLLLMIPNMFKISAEMLPAVFHVSARSVATHALSIFGDHSDVMACRQTGFSMLSSNSPQEAMDMALITHLSAIETSLPFLHFFDGFRTSHEVQKVEMIDFETIDKLTNKEAVNSFKKRAINPKNPTYRGSAENPDIFFQNREAINRYYDAIPEAVEKVMDKVSKEIGRQYKLFDYIGDSKAEKIIIAMGSGCETIEEYVNYAIAAGEKIGLLKVRLYRPFSAKHFLTALPETVKKIAVLDRTKEPGSNGEPLYHDVLTVLKTSDASSDIIIVGGRYGLSSKEFTPAMVKAVYDNLDKSEPKNDFSVGIIDDITFKSLDIGKTIETVPAGTIQCKFWGLGADGTVGANKNSIKIIGDNTDLYAQGHFVYDSKKSGGVTISHLRFGKEKIKSTYTITSPDFVACHNQSYLDKYNILEGIKDGGTFLLNSNFKQEEVFSSLPSNMQQTIISKKINFYNINALDIAKSVGLGSRVNVVMQTAFFELSNVIEPAKAIQLIKDTIKKTYGKKGQDIVDQNWKAVNSTVENLLKVSVPSDIQECKKDICKEYMDYDVPFVQDVIKPIALLQGDDLPVSKLPVDGVFPTATSKYEKRRIASETPVWLKDNCIQCNQCSFVCPHAVIRTKQIDPNLLKNKPETFYTLKSNTKNDKNLEYRVQVYIDDCTGCGSCVETCPAKTKALEMEPIETVLANQEVANYQFFDELPEEVTDGIKEGSLKWSQFKQPLFEFSGACAGCGETPYVKLITQLFGDRMVIANATGCSSIYGGTAPTTPYCQNKKGEGPAWANSLFEDNAEFGFGMRLAISQTRDTLYQACESALKLDVPDSLSSKLTTMIELKNQKDKAATSAAAELIEEIEKSYNNVSEKAKQQLNVLKENSDYFIDKSCWILGGDGWAYDIGYGGLDHVLASGENVNVLVVDTEVYSNTGGQSSKATPIGATAKFASSGKKMAKKDLGLMAMSYGYVYVASVDMGANKNQVLKAMLEAEAYPGPSIVIAYAPCIAHGIDLRHSMEQAKKAVESGHWPLYRYNPSLEVKKMSWDSKPASIDFKDYILSERRYSSLKLIDNEEAEKLFAAAEEDRKKRLAYLQKLSEIM